VQHNSQQQRRALVWGAQFERERRLGGNGDIIVPQFAAGDDIEP